MPRKLSPEQSAKIKALFRAALALPDGIYIPKPKPSECESLRVLLFAEKKSWTTSDPLFHAEVEHLTVRIEKDTRGNKVGVRIVPLADPTAGLEVFIAQAEISQKAKFVRPATLADCSVIERGEVYGPAGLAQEVARQKEKQVQELSAIERDLEDRLRGLGLSQPSDDEQPFNYSAEDGQ